MTFPSIAEAPKKESVKKESVIPRHNIRETDIVGRGKAPRSFIPKKESVIPRHNIRETDIVSRGLSPANVVRHWSGESPQEF